MKRGTSLIVDAGTIRMWLTLVENGDELSKKAAQAGVAAMSPSGRAAFLRTARTLIEWVEEVEGEKTAHQGGKKTAAKKSKKGAAK
jgi:2-keto-3-deoxy-galactonokinase